MQEATPDSMPVAATVDSENVQNQGVLQKRCFSRRSLHRLFFSQSPAVSAVPTSRNSMAGKVCEKLVRHVVHEDLGGSFSVHPCAVSLYKVEHLLQSRSNDARHVCILGIILVLPMLLLPWDEMHITFGAFAESASTGKPRRRRHGRAANRKGRIFQPINCGRGSWIRLR